MFHLAVVPEEARIVNRGLDPQNEAELVIDFQRDWPPGVFDSRSFHPDMEAVAHLAFVLRAQFPPEKGGNVVRLHSMNRRPDEIVVDGGRIG